MQSSYPGTYAYLLAHYDRLVPKCVSRDGTRDVPNATADTWYQYGRTQALTAFINTPKLIVGVLSKEPMYAMDTNDILIASGGTAGYCAVSKKDFIDFIRDDDSTVYNGNWNIYFVKRDFSSDLLGMKDIRTGKITFDEGVVYELSDDKFIFNLMNFPKHSCFEMTNLFDILKKNYKLVEGVGENGGYHAQVFMSSLFSQMDFS